VTRLKTLFTLPLLSDDLIHGCTLLKLVKKEILYKNYLLRKRSFEKFLMFRNRAKTKPRKDKNQMTSQGI